MKERNNFIERYNQLISCKGNVQQMNIDINIKEDRFFLYEIYFIEQTKQRRPKKFLVPFFFKFFLSPRKNIHVGFPDTLRQELR